MLGLIATSTVLFTWLAYLQYANFSAETNDLTIVTYAFAHTDWKNFLPLYYESGGNLMGNHVDVIYIVMMMVFKIVPTVPFVFFMQSLLISASAWPLYLLARRKLADNFAALCIAGAYLVFPPVVSQHLNQIHDDQLANISLFFAALFFEEQRFWFYSFAVALACMTKEVITPTMAMFGVWAFLVKRSLRWVAFPIVFATGWFFLVVKFLASLGQVAGGQLYTQTKYFDLYGKSPVEVLHTFFTHPGFVLGKTFGPDKIGYLIKLLGPLLLFLPFCSVAVVLCVPNLVINLVGTNSALTVMTWHYGVVLGAALFISLVYSLPKVVAWLWRRVGGQDYVKSISVCIFLLSLSAYPLWLDTSRFESRPECETLRGIVDSVPRDVAVICPSPMLAHFSHQRKLTTAYSLIKNQGGVEKAADYDVVILDGNWRNIEALSQQPLLEWIQKSGAYDLVLNQNNVFVFQKRSGAVPAP